MSKSDNPLEVITLGHPVLRQVAEPVANVHDPAIQQLIDQLIDLAKARNGVGIAASQVGKPWRIMIIASHPTPRYPDAPDMAPTALINPRMLTHSIATEKDWEGCLSVPNQRAQVPRYQSVTVAYTDRQGESQSMELHGFVARIFQHEYDHFNGLVFLDRVEDGDAVISEADYRAILQKNTKKP